MKKILVGFFLSALLVTSASAQFAGPSAVTTVEQTQTMRLGRDVTLEGFVVERLREDYYTFRDDTGEIRAEIERRLWRNRRVTSKTPVRLTGEIERDVRGRYISVDRLQILE